MALLKSVRIKNFRSIIDEKIELEDFNCFVGKNDCGKSNVLKALNLFFNGKTDFNTDYNFDTDYSKYAKPGTHQAKEISISVEINVPETFKENGIKEWTKVWRKEGLYADNLNELFEGKTKAITFLSRITYLYIPAVKSNEYFKNLLSDLYSSMTGTVDSSLRALNSKYSKQLQALTVELSSDIKGVLDMDSELEMPPNLEVLFRDLSFSTNDKFVRKIDLNYRGDGVKARHIPSILRFMQKNVEKYRPKRAIVTSYVWGYEEPENGIEFLSCYEMANELFSYSNDAQLLITTHSPAFYSITKNEASKCYFVYKSENGNSKYDTEIEESEIDEKIGLMPLVTPYINQEREKMLIERSTLENRIKEMENKIKSISGNIILITEGKTDTKLIKKSFEELDVDKKFISRISYYEFINNTTLGDDLNKLLDKLKNIDNASIIVGIFDRDKPICSCGENDFIYLGKNVYKTNIPAVENDERNKDDKICIEHYFSNSEIGKELPEHGHLYMGKDFNEYGVSNDGKYCFQGWSRNNSIKPISIIDGANKHLQQISDGAKIATKDQFAEYVINHPNEFNFDNFINIYELILKIVENHDKM